MAELKKCAHCLGKADYENYYDNDPTSKQRIYCTKCGVKTEWFDDKEQSRNSWNTRADDWINSHDERRKSYDCDGVLLCVDGKTRVGYYSVDLDAFYAFMGGYDAEEVRPTHFRLFPEPPKGAGG